MREEEASKHKCPRLKIRIDLRDTSNKTIKETDWVSHIKEVFSFVYDIMGFFKYSSFRDKY